MRFNCARHFYDGCFATTDKDNVLSIFSSTEEGSVSAVCRFRCFSTSIRCFALCGRSLAVFEENRLCVLERRSPDTDALHKWHAILRSDVSWLASDASVFDQEGSDEVVVAAASIVGAHVFSLKRSCRSVKHQVFFPTRAIGCVHVRKSCMAVAWLDGHVAVGRREVEFISNDERKPLVWFCEKRITGLELSKDELFCGAVCWDGSGAILAPSDPKTRTNWSVTRILHAPYLLSSIPRARMNHPAFGTFCAGEWRVYYNGGLKTFDEDQGVVNWICKEDDCHTGFCKLDEKSVIVVLENQIKVVKLA